jgi:hypothetical protein
MGSDVVVMMSATIWLVKNSNTPSDAMTMNYGRGWGVEWAVSRTGGWIVGHTKGECVGVRVRDPLERGATETRDMGLRERAVGTLAGADCLPHLVLRCHFSHQHFWLRRHAQLRRGHRVIPRSEGGGEVGRQECEGFDTRLSREGWLVRGAA